MELAKTRLYTFGLQKLIKIFGRITMMLIRIVTLCHKFGFKAVAILLFLILAAQPSQATPMSTIQGLHSTHLFIQFQKDYGCLRSNFGYQQYVEMETALVDAIIQFMQAAAPPTTTTTPMPIFQMNN
jgi:hypothetical protein